MSLLSCRLMSEVVASGSLRSTAGTPGSSPCHQQALLTEKLHRCNGQHHQEEPESGDRKKIARRRWAILAKALKKPIASAPESPTDECSVRRISSFLLFTTTQLDYDPPILTRLDAHDEDTTADAHHLPIAIAKRTWYRYKATADDSIFDVFIGHRRGRTISAEDLMGFNNTGNVCIWPSEETLAYYVVTHRERFRDKTVLELGGGMSCLAGLVCARYCHCARMLLTDGNRACVDNVRVSAACNVFRTPLLGCEVLRWNQAVPSDHLRRSYDVILCADCLFFDEAREDLVVAIGRYLAAGGVALVMAPRRGRTLDMFRERALGEGFACKLVERYSEVVWGKHLSLLDSGEYDSDIHYPLLLELTMVLKSRTAD